MSDQFSLRRLTLLIRNDLVAGFRTLGIVSVTVGMLAIMGPAGLAYASFVESDFYRSFFIYVLFVWGTITTSLAFRDLHGRGTNAAFLLLPATALEKTAARLIVNTVLLVVYLLLLTTVLSLIGEGLEAAGLTNRNEIFSPLDRGAWAAIPHYLAVQAVFFLGAAWFRKLHYVKTLLSAAVLIAVLTALIWLVGLVLYGSEVFATERDGAFVPFDALVDGARIAYYWALPLFCWYVAWLRVKEAQVSHAV